MTNFSVPSNQSEQDAFKTTDKVNVVFHIWSRNGKPVEQFLGVNTITRRINANVVLFESGTEFLVCRKEVDAQNSDLHHIYLREINLGWRKNVIHWLNPQGQDNFVIDKFFRHAQFWDTLKDSQMMHKSHSLTSMAYFESPFFKISLEVCDNFKFVQTASRENENEMLVDGEDQIEPRHAGALFTQQLKIITDQMEKCNKVSVTIHESLKGDNEEETQTQIVKSFEECQVNCLFENNWQQGQVKICSNHPVFCDQLGIDFSNQFRMDQFDQSFMNELTK